MKKIIIEPGCISCGTCAFIAPDCFEVKDIAHVKNNASFENNKEKIREAAQACPVQVITYKE
ncbi:MAG: ferredoxin [bacterium]|nr:ferredoxin [bacterium]